jgi:hypothetical protein
LQLTKNYIGQQSKGDKMSKKEKTEETKSVAVKPPSALTSELAAEFDFGDASMFNFRDLIIPKVLVMQGLSKLVAEGEAKMGDIVDTAANTVVGSVREKDRKPLRFYPLQMFRYWIKRIVDADGKLQFDSAVPWTAGNADMPWDIMDGARKIGVNEETIVFSVVPENQIDDIDQPPRLLSFRKTSLKQTKALKHHFFMCMSTRKEVPFQTAFELSGRLDKNDKGEQWYLPEVLPKGKAEDETAVKLMGFYKRYGTAIKEKVAGLIDDEEPAPVPRDVAPAQEPQEERLKF